MTGNLITHIQALHDQGREPTPGAAQGTTQGQALVDLLLRIGQLAESQGSQAYLVGGVVRDLLRGVSSVDLDLMVLSDVGKFVTCLYKVWPERFAEYPPVRKPVIFKKYLTAKLAFTGSVAGVTNLDIASARAEQYAHPAANPSVVPGTLETDLARRDFSINAMAIALSGDEPGTLVDHWSGVRDLQARELTILHDQSFVDDPARLIRGVRFQVRFGFDFDSQTRARFEEALAADLLQRLPPGRLFDELRKAFDEPEPLVCLALARSGILQRAAAPLAAFDQEAYLALSTDRGDEGRSAIAYRAAPMWQQTLARLALSAGAHLMREFLLQFDRADLIEPINTLAAQLHGGSGG